MEVRNSLMSVREQKKTRKETYSACWCEVNSSRRNILPSLLPMPAMFSKLAASLAVAASADRALFAPAYNPAMAGQMSPYQA